MNQGPEAAGIVRYFGGLRKAPVKSLVGRVARSRDLVPGTREGQYFVLFARAIAHRGGRNERLISLCHRVGAQRYLSGPAAREYLDEDLFAGEGIQVVYADYSDYPEYPQRFAPFDHHVSIIDLILNVGPDAPRLMKSFARADEFIVTPAAGSGVPPT